jgi:hypothetical protein
VKVFLSGLRGDVSDSLLNAFLSNQKAAAKSARWHSQYVILWTHPFCSTAHTMFHIRHD